MGTVQPETTAPAFGCSTLTVSTPVGVLFGRNYDWENCTAMLVHTLPKDGYESVSTTCPDFLGFGADWVPDGDITSRMMALAAVYIPLDGMNEMGLCVADLMAGDDEETHQQSHRPDLTTTTALRLLLDRAATVDEALNLLSQYDMNSDIGTAHHFAIADASGRSVAVEYIEGKMIVTETPILTNHYLARGKQDAGSRSSHFRFDTLTSLYPDVQNADALLAAMKGVAQSRDPFADEYEATQWTLVFDTKQKTARFYRNERFGKPYHLSLGQKTWLDCPK